ncbi:DUF2087 domain-containing protein [Luteipulveratus sp. YIM 133132]|uniref:DUF2087 domain-containing protein n=1 Tax=Luteipulveratus flavus TaxID=3031728 RepID=UPI0023AFCB13|nr:DUF2087 domain-containing protein [Luteipulveratus sp. YIM 133132]MDE9365496.1 DUF2087 domain-containing protein [Luteipulveratus sp. YIM 133132]
MELDMGRVVATEPRLAAFVRHHRLTRIPRRPAVAQLLYGALAAQLPAGVPMSETTVNNYLRAVHDDVATLRRALVDHSHLHRSADGRCYVRPADPSGAEPIQPVRR